MAKKQQNSVQTAAAMAEPTIEITPIEQTVNAFEYAAWHFGSAFARWRRDCLGAMPAMALGGTEASILHVLHLNGTAKGLSDVARLLHRDDLANPQYGLKKLLSLGFIEKASNGASRRNTTYAPSEAGRAIVDTYLQNRRDILVRLVGSMSGTQEALQQASSILHVMTGLYDQASTILSSQIGDTPGLRP
jgi:predicted MarR family transcription regulator